MTEQSDKRRRWIVNPRYQLRFALILVLLHVNVGFLYQIALHYRVQNLISEAGSVEAYLAMDPWAAIWPAMLIAGAISTLVVFFIGIRYSHQIVGPIPRIARALRRIAEGERPQPLEVRPGDAIEELAAAVNELVDSAPSQPEAPQDEEPRIDAASIIEEAVRRETINT
jgi:methyl-accepting chemotaxis protein